MGITAQYLSVSEDELALYQVKSIFLEERLEGIKTDDADFIDIDKAWDGIIFLLTGHGITKAKGQLLRVIVSNQYVDEYQDLGYGPAHFLSSSEVKELYGQIAHLDVAAIEARFDSVKMKELGVYPDIWDEVDAFEYLSSHLLRLVDFFRKAAAQNKAIIGMMNKDERKPIPKSSNQRPFWKDESHWWKPIHVLSICAILMVVYYTSHMLG